MLFLAKISVDEIFELLNEHDLLVHSDLIDNQTLFSAIAYNSKLVSKNCLFFCKGNFKPQYLIEAQKRGAICYMAENHYENVTIPGIFVKDIQKSMSLISAAFFAFPQNQLKTVAYTGTKGKTTSAYFTKAILDETFPEKVGLFSTINTVVGNQPGDVFKSHLTTPESLDLFTNMNRVVKNGLSHLVLEVSSQAYKKDRVYNLKYDVGNFLNISPDHIGKNEHPTFADYMHCKEQLLVNSRRVVINANMDHIEDIYMAAKTTTQPEDIFMFARKGISVNDKYPIDFEYFSKEDSLTSNQIQINPLSEKAKSLGLKGIFKVSIAGDYNEENATAAAISASLVGASNVDVSYGLSHTTVPGRMESYSTKKHGKVYVDYAHNYASLNSVLAFLHEQEPSAKISVVTGSTGDKGQDRRSGLGKAINQFANRAYLTTDDPGTENPKTIAQEIAEYIVKPNITVRYIADRKAAIKNALSESSKNNIVLVAGKGQDKYQKIDGKDVPYESDSAIVSELSKGL